MSKYPAHKFKIGLTTATIWGNDGFYSVDISRAYKNDQGEWQSTAKFFHADLLNLARCAERAETWIGRQLNERQ